MFFRITILTIFLVILNISFHQCAKFEDKIVGGTAAEIKEFPFQIALLYNGQFRCGGSIINKKWIVTAAHCVHGAVKTQFSIRAGSTFYASGGDVIKAEKVIPNPNYNPKNMQNDIALIKLVKEIDFNRLKIKAVDLPTGENPKTATISGWGTKKEDGPASSNLQKATVTVFDNKYCKSLVSIFNGNLMLCAGKKQGGVDSCQGDSGGPLVNNNKLYGVVSFGIGCARAKHPGVYTKVVKYLSFIKDTISKN